MNWYLKIAGEERIPAGSTFKNAYRSAVDYLARHEPKTRVLDIDEVGIRGYHDSGVRATRYIADITFDHYLVAIEEE